jgi:hypothetical protein
VLNYWITSWREVLLAKTILVATLLKILTAFHGTIRLITTFTKFSYRSLSGGRIIQVTLFHFISIRTSFNTKLVGLIRVNTISFPTTDSLLILYFALARSKLDYASAAWELCNEY